MEDNRDQQPLKFEMNPRKSRKQTAPPVVLLRLTGILFFALGILCIFDFDPSHAATGRVIGATLALIGYFSMRARLVAVVGVLLIGGWFLFGGLVMLILDLFHPSTLNPHVSTSVGSVWEGACVYIFISCIFIAAAIQGVINRKSMKWI